MFSALSPAHAASWCMHSIFTCPDAWFPPHGFMVQGLSARSVLINAFCQLIILLYLFDNETSMVVLFSSVVGCGIEFWKASHWVVSCATLGGLEGVLH